MFASRQGNTCHAGMQTASITGKHKLYLQEKREVSTQVQGFDQQALSSLKSVYYSLDQTRNSNVSRKLKKCQIFFQLCVEVDARWSPYLEKSDICPMEPLRNAPPLFEVLTQKAANGDNKAFQQLYDHIAGKMYSLCLRYAGNANDANDCFQEGFVKLYRHLAGFRGDGSFEGWARRIFVGTCIDFIRKKKAVLTSISEDIDIASDGLNGYDKLTNEDLMKMIRQLPDGYRTVINLNLVEGYNHKEIGEMLDISEEGSRSQLFRARAYLQKLFKETNGE